MSSSSTPGLARVALALKLDSKHRSILEVFLVAFQRNSGIELARTLRQRKPELEVVIMTGYSSELLKADSLTMPGEPPRIMRKPFDIATAINTMASA